MTYYNLEKTMPFFTKSWLENLLLVLGYGICIGLWVWYWSEPGRLARIGAFSTEIVDIRVVGAGLFLSLLGTLLLIFSPALSRGVARNNLLLDSVLILFVGSCSMISGISFMLIATF